MEKFWVENLEGIKELIPEELLIARKIVLSAPWEDTNAFRKIIRKIDKLYFLKTGEAVLGHENEYSNKFLDPRWQRKRLEIMKRDGFKCLDCGREDKTLHVHHLKYQGEPWEAPNEYLKTLCEDCHSAAH